MEPIGFACPLRTASTPATKVVATAPIPGIMMPSLPLAGAILSLAVFFSFAILGSLLLMNFRGEVQRIYVLVTRVDLQTTHSPQRTQRGTEKKEQFSFRNEQISNFLCVPLCPRWFRAKIPPHGYKKSRRRDRQFERLWPADGSGPRADRILRRCDNARP